MKMWRYIYDNYGFTIIFYASIICIIVVLIYNIFTGTKGTFQNHTKMMVNLLNMQNGKESNFKKRDSSGEIECRRVAEKYLKTSFSKQRPDFLKNIVTGSNLEIDCYNNQLKLGIEYNGRQHYEFVPYFHASKDAFYSVKYRDEMKKRLCSQNGVQLIIVPYTIAVGDIEQYLTSKFRELNLLK